VLFDIVSKLEARTRDIERETLVILED